MPMSRPRSSAPISSAAPTSVTSPCSRRSAPRPGSTEKTLKAFRETREGDAALVGSEERLRGLRRAHGAQPAVRWTRARAGHRERGYLRARARPGAVPDRATKTTKAEADAALSTLHGTRAAVVWRLPRGATYGRMSQARLKTDLRAIVGEQGMLEGAAVRERGRALFHGRVEAELLVRPRSTEQVSGDLRLCHARGQPVVTHGGLTGLVQGADAGAATSSCRSNR